MQRVWTRLVRGDDVITAPQARFAATYGKALQAIVDQTNEFNDQQSRDIDAFNDEYCALLTSGTAKVRVSSSITCSLCAARGLVSCNRIEQRVAEVTVANCPYIQTIVPRLFADIDRLSYNDEVCFRGGGDV